MNIQMLSTALRNKGAELRQINVGSGRDEQLLRDAADLLRALANVAEGMPLARALGSPGDWGYGTQIGDALAAKPAGDLQAF